MTPQTKTAAYDAIIDEHEDRAFLDCGCQLWHLSSHSPLIVALKHCPLHSGAQELLTAARRMLAWTEREDSVPQDLDAQLRTAITNAERPGGR